MSAQLDRQPRFEPMRFDDVSEVVDTEDDIYAFPWTRSNFTDSLSAGYSAWVCRFGDEIIAYGVMMQVLDEAHLLNLSVKRSWQGRGYGYALLHHFFALARGAGAVRMFLEVRPSNEHALALYTRCGFQPVGVRRGYYPSVMGREDAIVMAVDL